MPEAPSVTRIVRAARAAVDEHLNLKRLVGQVEAAFSRPEPQASRGPDVVAARLDALRGPHGAHFDEEERAGLFEQIEGYAPEHATLCARLRDEHETILRRLDTLRTASPLDRRRPPWITEVRHLLDEVHGHETREADLLTRALDGSTPAAD